MFRNEKLELKVGLFMGVGIFVMFLIVFSIRDVSLMGKGYEFNVIFDFVNGLTDSSPVRLAGVNVGEVKAIELYYDEKEIKTRVNLKLWVRGSVKVEKDAEARINTLGLLGEQYLEISPGVTQEFIAPGDTMIGHNPVEVGKQMEKMTNLVSSLSNIMKQVESGQGTLGKFIMNDSIYNDLEVIFGRIRNGEGTVGKLLTKDDIYNNLDGFVADIKANPWKLLQKPKTSSSTSTTVKRGQAVRPR
jgi:phospholipid/cholesterol/gamma-HCH transport system substrate-binding protein